ncbi:MAG: hypothetical protein K0S01_3078 [Herbinix sp.]|jgi:hypothetical protein|nr:hypothetical protein [Herbinix sp.]
MYNMVKMDNETQEILQSKELKSNILIYFVDIYDIIKKISRIHFT